MLFLSTLSLFFWGCRDKDSLEDTDLTDTSIVEDTGTAVDLDADGHSASTDCNDLDPAVHPDAPETCNGHDDDCNGLIDDSDPGIESQLSWYADNDGDGFGDPNDLVLSCEQPLNYEENALDCNDESSAFNPTAIETDCSDPNDYNCDGSVGYEDADGDGAAACEDCDDSDATAYEGASETCDEIDNDCDGEIDEDATDATTFYGDADGDGHGGSLFILEACAAPDGYVTTDTDCDDLDASSHPGAQEICDLADNDCDSTIDEGVENTWYTDADGDGYGDATSSTLACNLPPGHASNALDCDDSEPTTNPSAFEICDTIDNNCDGQADGGDAINATEFYADADNDGFGDINSAISACSAPSGFVSNSDDCDDTNTDAYPGATEVCDSVDNDCDTFVDENVGSTYYADNDADGYGDPNNSLISCTVPTGYVTDNTDCDDANTGANPGAAEVCDSVDNNCDTFVDENVGSTYYADNDADGYGDPNNSLPSCTVPTGYVTDNTDCNDDDAAISPGDPENCSDTIDNNCDGNIDETYGAQGATGACAGTSCLDILNALTGPLPDGIYTIDPAGTGAFDVTCDMTTDNGGWTKVTGELMSAQSWTAFHMISGSSNNSGWDSSSAFVLGSGSSSDATMRAETTLPFSFGELYGTWTSPADNSRHADDNTSTSSWASSANSCQGWILFGTPDVLLKSGGEWGGDFNTNTDQVWTQSQTTVTTTSTLRFESNQECAMPAESVTIDSISLFLR